MGRMELLDDEAKIEYKKTVVTKRDKLKKKRLGINSKEC